MEFEKYVPLPQAVPTRPQYSRWNPARQMLSTRSAGVPCQSQRSTLDSFGRARTMGLVVKEEEWVVGVSGDGVAGGRDFTMRKRRVAYWMNRLGFWTRSILWNLTFLKPRTSCSKQCERNGECFCQKYIFLSKLKLHLTGLWIKDRNTTNNGQILSKNSNRTKVISLITF